MYRTDADGNVANMFDDGDPMVPRVATQLDAAWHNEVQEEICSVVTASGITLVKGTRTQLRDAINTHAPTIHVIGGSGEPTFQAHMSQSSGSDALCFYLDRGVLRIVGTLLVTSGASSLPAVCSALPTAYRPTAVGSFYRACFKFGATLTACLVVYDSNGNLFIAEPTAGVGGTYRFDVSIPLNQPVTP